jgi:pyroglutamyl-peptidase
MLEAAIPVELSLSAGAFLCNQVFYIARHYIANSTKDIPMGFIHLPALPQQAARATVPFASMSFEIALSGIQTALVTIAERL